MIVNCPSCSAQFRVPDDVVPSGGRKMRCSACSHVWHFPHPDDVFEADTPDFLRDLAGSADDAGADDFAHVLQQEMQSGTVVPPLPQPEDTVKPASKPFRVGGDVTKRPFWRFDADGRRGYAAALVVLCLIILGMNAISGPLTRLIPAVKPLYTLFGAPAPVVAVPDVTMGLVNVTRPDAEKLPKVIKIDGVLSNNSDVEQAVLPIRVRLLGAKPDTVVAAWVFKPSTAKLAAGETAPFDIARAVEVIDDVKSVDLQFVVPKAAAK